MLEEQLKADNPSSLLEIKELKEKWYTKRELRMMEGGMDVWD
jgi:hypothetical protein